MKTHTALHRAARLAATLAGRVARAAAAAAIVAAPLVAAPDPASANAPSEDAARADRYLGELLAEINARRARVGTPPLAYAGPSANAAVSQYLADLTPLMVAYNACFHGMGNPVAPGWDYVAASGLRGEVGGEVLGCPGNDGYWTPKRIADGWWSSPSHFQSLYGDPSARLLACGTYGPQKNGSAYQTIACLTYRV
jgi:hypothetical protein